MSLMELILRVQRGEKDEEGEGNWRPQNQKKTPNFH